MSCSAARKVLLRIYDMPVRGLELAALALLLCGASALHAQSSNPAELRRIIEQKNAAAAADTWGYYVPTAAAPAPSYPTSPSAPGTGGNGGVGGSSSAGVRSDGAVGFTSPGASSGSDPDEAKKQTPDQPAASQPDPAVGPDSADDSDSDAILKPAATPASTTVEPDSPVPAPTTAAKAPVVTMIGGLLEVQSDDSSLLATLAEICRRTGMTLSGTVVDERVFGTLGPARPAQVIGQLLDGVKTNFMLRQNSTTKGSELVLTPILKR